MSMAEEMMADIEKDTVDFVENFDNTTAEPVVLPTRYPNLIVNGANGIAVGMATNIPPHNLTEIVDATITLVNNPKAGLAEVMQFVQGPDFPTGGFIHGKGGIVDAYKTGRGRFMMRAKAAIENISGGRQAIVVTEIPYQVNKARMVERIAELTNNKVIDDISDIRDESDRDGMRVVVELKRGAEPQIVLNQLYKHTQMQESFSMIFLAVANNQPKEMGLVQAIRYFIEHRIDVVRRRTAFLLAKAKDREHILEGYRLALDHIDNVIAIIRGSADRANARENLIAYFAGKKIDINTTGRAPKLDPEKPFTHEAGGRDPRIAIAPFDAALHRRNREGVGIDQGRDRRVRIDPRFGEEAPQRDREGTRGDQEGIRRRPPHADRRRDYGDSARRLDRRRAGRGHGQSRWLPEAHADHDLPFTASWRHRTPRHEHARRRFRRASLHRVDARVPVGLHQHGPRLLAEGVRDSRRRRCRQRQARGQPGCTASRAKPCARFCRCAISKKRTSTSSSSRARAR